MCAGGVLDRGPRPVDLALAAATRAAHAGMPRRLARLAGCPAGEATPAWQQRLGSLYDQFLTDIKAIRGSDVQVVVPPTGEPGSVRPDGSSPAAAGCGSCSALWELLPIRARMRNGLPGAAWCVMAERLQLA